MNSIPASGSASLYNLDCTYLEDVRFKRESLETITIIFFGKPSEDFPERFFFMPEGRTYDYRAFIFALTEEIHTSSLSSESGPCYTARAVTNDIPEQRKNCRVYVTFQAAILPKGEKKETFVTIKDIGTGGFQFVSKQKFETDTIFTSIFRSIKAPECITARIQKQRPVREKGVYSYGCQFVDLPPKLEMLIRNFVFQTEALQAKAKRERENA
ncbi:MAG: PilZ domain-containing protein [Lachnospiraceae bacterium]